MKKVLVVLLVLALALTSVFAGGSKANAKKVLAVVTPAPDHGFTGESVQHAEAELKLMAEKEGFTPKFYSAGESSEQANAIDTMLAENPSAFVLWPVNGDELKSSAQKIMDAGVPLIVYDRFISNFVPDAEISGDNVAIGEQAGRYFNEYFKDELAKGKVKYLEFKGDSSSVPMERTNGFLSTASPNFECVQSFVTDWSTQKSMEQMENYLNTKSVAEIESIQAIFTHDDEIVKGIVEALKNYHGPAKINIKLINGVAANKEFMGLIENPPLGIDYISWTFSPSMVRDAIDLGVKALKGEKLEKTYRVPTEVIDKTNYKEYMQSDLYVTRYSL